MLKTQVPDSQIHFLTKNKFAFLLQNNPYVDHVHTLADDLTDTVELLKKEHFDHIIDLHHNLRTLIIKRKMSLPSFSFDKLNWEKWLMVNFKVNKLPNRHIVERYLDTVSVFDIKNDNKGLDFFIPEQDRYPMSRMWTQKGFAVMVVGATYYTKQIPIQKAVDCYPMSRMWTQKGFAVMVVGATYYTKQIPIQKAVDIINGSKLPFVLLGGPEDVEKSKKISDLLTVPYLDFSGKINLNQSASVIEQSCAVVTSDTGLMHIASALNKPILSLWGNTIPEFGMRPYLPNSSSRIFEVNDLKCRPCSKIGFQKCPKSHFNCMNQIDHSEIVKSLVQIHVTEHCALRNNLI